MRDNDGATVSDGRSSDENLPEHIHDTVKASSLFHTEHQRRATFLTRFIQAATTGLARPFTLIVFLLLTFVWIGVNLRAHSFDAYPYPLFGTICGFCAVLVALAILTTQQHENCLSENRAKITFELAILSEQKLSKIIEMLDDLRRDIPNVKTIIDPTIEVLSTASDPESIIKTLQESRKIIDGEKNP